jgi:excisionase family DNA binding protein
MITALSPLDRRLLTERDVADIFTVSTRTVRRWASTGELTAIRIGGVTRYREDEVLSVIRPHNEEGAAPGNATPSENSLQDGQRPNGSYST